MRRSIIPTLMVLLICVVAVGFYRGWFTLSSRNADTGSNKVNVNLTVDKDKIDQDVEAVKEKTGNLVHQATEQKPAPAEKTTADR